MAASCPLLIRRYTVMFDTRIVAATSPTVRRRSPTNPRRLLMSHLPQVPQLAQLSQFQHLPRTPPLPQELPGVRTVTIATCVVNPLSCLLSARYYELHRCNLQIPQE